MTKQPLRTGFTLGGRLDRTLEDSVTPRFSLDHEADLYWMEQALLTAMNAVGWSAPNPSVGAVIVDPKSNVLLSSGFTQTFRHEHAERMAILEAQKNHQSLQGATLYVTLEPCSHFGSQPPCADLVVQSGIKRVVMGALDTDPKVNGQGVARLKAAGIEVVLSELEPECVAWHLPFFITRAPHKKIMWAAKWAQTPKGHLFDPSDQIRWISNLKSRAYTHWLRQKYDAILVSAKTWIHDQPQLNVRDCAKPHRRHPHRLILDRSGRLAGQRLPSDVRVVRSVEEVEGLIFDPPLQSVLVEGGPKLLASLFEQGKVDVAHQFVGNVEFDAPLGPDARRFQAVYASQAQQGFVAANQKIDDDCLQEWVKSF